LGTRQTFLICRVSNSRNSANFASLPCVNVQALGKLFLFAVCHGPGTRQTLTPLPCVTDQALGKASTFAVCHILRTRQTRPRMHGILASLPSFIAQTLGKEAILVPECTEFCHMYTLPNIFTLALGKLLLLCRVSQALGKPSTFAVCHIRDTRQTFVLCRVSNTRHSANTSQNA